MTTPTDGARVVAVALNGNAPFRLEDLPLEDVDRIAKLCAVPWIQVVGSPLQDLIVGKLVVEAVAAHLGYPAPETRSTRALADLFTTVPDEMPDMGVQFPDEPDPLGSTGPES